MTVTVTVTVTYLYRELCACIHWHSIYITIQVPNIHDLLASYLHVYIQRILRMHPWIFNIQHHTSAYMHHHLSHYLCTYLYKESCACIHAREMTSIYISIQASMDFNIHNHTSAYIHHHLLLNHVLTHLCTEACAHTNHVVIIKVYSYTTIYHVYKLQHKLERDLYQ